MKLLDLTGQKFNRLTTIERVENDAKTNNARWLFRCDCGVEKSIVGHLVYHGHIQSCGCLLHDNTSRVIHGHTGEPEFVSWVAMRQRCNNTRTKAYPHYGGRGIAICPEWNEFSRFLLDMGPRPPGTSLERVKNDEGYSPENCIWADRKAQVRNRRTTTLYEHGGETLSLQEWGEKVAVPYGTIWHRYKVGKRGAELLAPVQMGGDRRSRQYASSRSVGIG